MKKINYLLLGVAGLALASCSQNDLESITAPGEGNFTLTVNLPVDYSTRTVNDGLTANNLLIAVYDADNNNQLVFEDEATFNGGISTTVGMNLASGKTYTIALFATAEDENTENPVYSFNASAQTLTMTYANMQSGGIMADTYDCFYNVDSTGVISSTNNSLNVTLYRPIAQLNWGTDDYAEKAIQDNNAFGTNGQYVQTTLKTEAYTTLNLLTGDVQGEMEKIEIKDFAAPQGLTFPVTYNQTTTNDDGTTTTTAVPYSYVAMQYVLAPKDESTVYDLTLNISNALNPNATATNNDVVVANAPVQANYQTNIYGSLLSDDFTLTVTKDKNWTSSFDVEVGVTEPETNDDGNYLITSQAELNWITEQVNQENNNFNGKTILIQNDIYMTGTWTPVGTGPISSEGTAQFNGTIDGQGYTIYNLIVNTPQAAGFIGSLYGTVQNLNFDNASITTSNWGGVVVGQSYGTISNCNVSNSTVTSVPQYANGKWDNGDKAGIICGFMREGNMTITGCNVTDCSIKAYRDLGGVVGYASTGTTVSGCSVNGLTLIIDNSHNYNSYTTQDQYDANPVIGDSNGTDTGNTSSSVNIIMVPSAGSNTISATVSSLEGIQAVAEQVANLTGPTANITFADDVTIDMEGQPVESLNLFRNEIPINVDFNNATFKNVVLTDEYPNVFSKVNGTITGLTIEGLTANLSGSGQLCGFIGVVESGSVSDITISNVNINAPKYDQVGAVAGHTAEGASMTNCSVTSGSVTGQYGVGGITGTNTGNFTNCTVSGLNITSATPATEVFGTGTGYMEGGAMTGGIIIYGSKNYSFTGTITDCTVNGTTATNPTQVSSFGYTWNSTSVAANAPTE